MTDVADRLTELDREAEELGFLGVPYQPPKLTKKDLMWLAGFLDASGSLVTRGAPRLIIRHHDEGVARRFADLTGGRVHGPRIDQIEDRPKPGKKYWLVTLYAYNELKRLYVKLLPYLSPARQREIEQVLASYDPPNPRKIEFGVDNCGYYNAIEASVSGFKKHQRAHEEPCRICTESQRLYYRRRDQGLL
jgi:hypothetical protein